MTHIPGRVQATSFVRPRLHGRRVRGEVHECAQALYVSWTYGVKCQTPRSSEATAASCRDVSCFCCLSRLPDCLYYLCVCERFTIQTPHCHSAVHQQVRHARIRSRAPHIHSSSLCIDIHLVSTLASAHVHLTYQYYTSSTQSSTTARHTCIHLDVVVVSSVQCSDIC